jgi:hypothetical protein
VVAFRSFPSHLLFEHTCLTAPSGSPCLAPRYLSKSARQCLALWRLGAFEFRFNSEAYRSPDKGTLRG